jgi:hypothetical protein
MFDQELTEPAREFRSSQLEGVWWLHSNKSGVRLALSNTTDSPLSATAAVERKEPIAFTLKPHETRVIDLQEPGRDQGDKIAKIGGISIKHSGAPGAVIADGFVQEPWAGYSNVIEFVDPQTAESAQLDGAGLRIGNVAGEELTQTAAVRNVGATASTVTGRIPYTLIDGSRQEVLLPELHLGPGEVREIDLNKFIKRSVQGQGVAAAGLEFSYSTAPGSVIAAALSMSPNGTHVFRTPLKNAAAQPSSTGKYPWSIDVYSSTIVYVKNTTDSPKRFTIQVGFDGGAYALGVQTIEGGQTKAYDVRALRDNQVPDARGTKIPLDATSG